MEEELDMMTKIITEILTEKKEIKLRPRQCAPKNFMDLAMKILNKGYKISQGEHNIHGKDGPFFEVFNLICEVWGETTDTIGRPELLKEIAKELLDLGYRIDKVQAKLNDS